jgi:hypothetical protein
MKCRSCSADITLELVDLGTAPPSNSYLEPSALGNAEKWFPLSVIVCEACWLVQTEYSPSEELFDASYAYFSSFSSSWLAHAEQSVALAVERFGLDGSSHVVEVAANDGYLLQYVKARGIPCLGVEPTHSTAEAARAKGIPIVEEFFGVALANKLVADGKAADVTFANNVLAHVPDIRDFAKGFAVLLEPEGVATFEFPHLLELIKGVQFDTIYHEHYSYLSLEAVSRVFEHAGLSIFDVESLPTHGGSLRVMAQRTDTGRRTPTERVEAMRNAEREAGVTSRAFYEGFQAATDRIKNELVRFLLDAKRAGKRVAGYGAAAKGNTLLNYAGIKPDLVSFVVDRSPAKRGKFMPGSRIPIVDEMHLKRERPDFVVLFPWNLRRELEVQLAYVKEWGGALVLPTEPPQTRTLIS